MAIKKCIGCLSEVEDKLNSPGIGTICDDCCFPLSAVPKEVPREFKCQHCSGATNLIGAFVEKVSGKHCLFLYFDCPNPKCAKNRIHLIALGAIKSITRITPPR